MSELRDECYKCLNNQNCIPAADYGSFYCMARRKFKMPENEDDSVYATKFAAMQKQIDDKDKRIKELEEENRMLALEGSRVRLDLYIKQNYIPKQKVKEILDKAEVMDYYTLPDVINDLQELLEEGE